MNKKIIVYVAALLFIAVIVGVIISIWVNRGVENDEEDEFLPAANQIDLKDLKDANLTIYFEAQGNHALTEVLEAVNKKLRNELKTELAFEFVWDYPDNYLSSVRKVIASGSPCDAFFYSSYFPATLQALATEGLVKDITSTFPQYAPDYYNKFTKEDIAAISVEDKLYAIPARIPDTDRICVLVRNNLMTKYNIPEIKSYSDYEVYLEAVKSKEPDLIPMIYWDTTLGLFSDVNGYATLDYQLGLVYKWDNPSIKLELWEQTAGFADGLNKIKSWHDKGYLLKDIGIAEIDDYMIKGGKWASFIGRWGDQMRYNAILTANGIKDYKYNAYQLHKGFSARNSPLENGLLVNAKSAEADRVLMFVNWLQSKQENYDLLMYGIKGTHYIEEKDYISPPEGTDMEDSFFGWGWKAPFRNMDYERANFSGLKEEIKRYNEVISEMTKYPPHLGFYPDYDPVSNIVNLRRMSFAKLDQMVYRGTFTHNDMEEYINEQKESGVDNLVLQIQQQLDKFAKAKY